MRVQRFHIQKRSGTFLILDLFNRLLIVCDIFVMPAYFVLMKKMRSHFFVT